MNANNLWTWILLVLLMIAIAVSADTSTIYSTIKGSAIQDTAINNTYADLRAVSRIKATEFDPKEKLILQSRIPPPGKYYFTLP